MKTLFPAAIGLLVGCVLHAAEPPSLAFGGERIGVPPLSLAESIAKSAGKTKPFQFAAALPSYTGEGRQNLSPNLLPQAGPNLASLKAAHPVQSPRISRESGMPIIEPNDAVDYKLTIVPPDPTIDFKMIVKEPALKSEREPAK